MRDVTRIELVRRHDRFGFSLRALTGHGENYKLVKFTEEDYDRSTAIPSDAYLYLEDTVLESLVNSIEAYGVRSRRTTEALEENKILKDQVASLTRILEKISGSL